jgi:hypothetical protein
MCLTIPTGCIQCDAQGTKSCLLTSANYGCFCALWFKEQSSAYHTTHSVPLPRFKEWLCMIFILQNMCFKSSKLCKIMKPVENNHPQLKSEIKVYLVASPDAMWSAIPLQAMAMAGWQRNTKGTAPLFSASALTFIYFKACWANCLQDSCVTPYKFNYFILLTYFGTNMKSVWLLITIPYINV